MINLRDKVNTKILKAIFFEVIFKMATEKALAFNYISKPRIGLMSIEENGLKISLMVKE